VIGGGNAALCAALAAADRGARVQVLEKTSPEWRGGNSKYTRNIRLVGQSYSEEEFLAGYDTARDMVSAFFLAQRGSAARDDRAAGRPAEPG